MQDFSKRQKPLGFVIRFLLSVAGVLVLGFVAIVMVRASYNMYGKFSEAAKARERAEERLALLLEQKEVVSAAVESFESSRGIETEVRKRYGVAKKGEGRIEIVRENPTSSTRVLSSQNILARFFEALWPF